MEERYLTVKALTKYIKLKFDCDKHLTNVLLEGEISNFKRNQRGHFYFTLKDDEAQISAVMFNNYASSVSFMPKDGMKVFVKGHITVYLASGGYQIYIKEMKQDGIGELYIKYEQLKKELNELGLFDSSHKKMIPVIPKAIGVITSPTGAAVHDIINTVRRRFPLTKIILYPALVQGEGAKESIVKQIKKANSDNLVNVIICGRGGGSIEDLWAFNEKVVAYAIYDSNIPIISAVGHEVDFTIADFVADKRAATPTAAAELATPLLDSLIDFVKECYKRINQTVVRILDEKRTFIANAEHRLELQKPNIDQYSERISELVTRLNGSFTKIIENRRLYVDGLSHQLKINHPLSKIEALEKEVTNYKTKLDTSIEAIMVDKTSQFKLNVAKLKALSPLSIMDKGYSIAYQDGKIIKKVEDVSVGKPLNLRVNDGFIDCLVTEVKHGK